MGARKKGAPWEPPGAPEAPLGGLQGPNAFYFTAAVVQQKQCAAAKLLGGELASI